MGTLKSIPNHLGLILDGNRRWAKSAGLSKYEGHKKGYDNLQDIAQEAFDAGVKYVSAYIFSTENWNRSKDEVGYLMRLVVSIASRDLDKIIKNNIKVVFLGSKNRISKDVKEAIISAEKKSEKNDGGTLALCFNYGGRQEIVSALKKIINKNINSNKIDEELIGKELYQGDIPDVDLLIRTSGEQRLSNFMLWRIAYSELYFVDKHWPAFTKQDLRDAFSEFSKRQRRYGK